MNEPATGETTPQEKGNTQGNSGPGKCRRKSSGGGGGAGALLKNLAFVRATIWLLLRLRRAQAAWRSC